MLKIYLGEMKGAIYHPPTYFDNCYEDEWLTTPLAKEMIRDVDRSEVISAHLIDSPVLGPIPPKDLSGGIKTLLLMAYDTDGKIFNASGILSQIPLPRDSAVWHDRCTFRLSYELYRTAGPYGLRRICRILFR